MYYYATPVQARLSACGLFTASQGCCQIRVMLMSVVSVATDHTAPFLQICRRLAVSLGKLHSGI